MTVAAIIAMAIGIILVVRSAMVVAVDGRGRFPLDPWAGLVVGFALIFLELALLK